MTDIVERLRSTASALRQNSDFGTSGVVAEAADEIERLRTENERLRDRRSRWDTMNAAPLLGSGDAEIERLRAVWEKAAAYAEQLAISLSKHYPENTVWEPLTGDLIGLLTQIDNATAGLVRIDEIERLREALQRIAREGEPWDDAVEIATATLKERQ